MSVLQCDCTVAFLVLFYNCCRSDFNWSHFEVFTIDALLQWPGTGILKFRLALGARLLTSAVHDAVLDRRHFTCLVLAPNMLASLK